MEPNTLLNTVAPLPALEQTGVTEPDHTENAAMEAFFNQLIKNKVVSDSVNADDDLFMYPRLNQGIIDDSEMSLADEAGL